MTNTIKHERIVIPALPGWNLVHPDFDNPSIPFRDPIIAWLVSIKAIPPCNKHEERLLCDAMPVTATDVTEDDGDYFLESPDGQIHQPFAESWANASDWTKEMERKEQVKAQPKGTQ